MGEWPVVDGQMGKHSVIKASPSEPEGKKGKICGGKRGETIGFLSDSKQMVWW